jgi:leader peptidase (prepilin peptidase) / N-methyltransferase
MFLFEQTTFVYLIFFAVLGLVFGSFGNVLIYRIPNNQGLGGRSKCPSCSTTIRSFDLIPVISYLLLAGRCRKCKATIAIRYPAIELISGVLFVLAYIQMGSVLTGLLLAFAIWLLLLIAAIDQSTQGIPDILNIPLIVISIAFGITQGHLSLIAFLIGTGFFFIQWAVSRGKWIGSGDVLLSIALTALLGKWNLVLVMLCSAYIVGSIFAVYLLIKKKCSGQDHLAFAPFLVIGTLIALFLGEIILSKLLLI